MTTVYSQKQLIQYQVVLSNTSSATMQNFK